MSEYIITNEQLNWLLERMDETDVIPSAIVLTHLKPIVRCKDCKHVYEHHDARGRWLLCNLQLYFEVKPDGFCSRGE